MNSTPRRRGIAKGAKKNRFQALPWRFLGVLAPWRFNSWIPAFAGMTKKKERRQAARPVRQHWPYNFIISLLPSDPLRTPLVTPKFCE
jgi:hypothetical protein